MVTGLSIGITASSFGITAAPEVFKNTAAIPAYVGGAYGGSASVDNSDVSASVNQWTLSFWTRRDSTATGDQGVLQMYRGSGGSGNKILVRWESNGDLEIYIVNGFKVNHNFSEMHYSTGDNDWHHFMLSFDADASTYQCYWDGVDTTLTTAIPTAIDLTGVGALGIGCDYTGGIAQAANGGNAQIALWLGTAYDLDDADVRKKFYNSGPVDMGDDGTRTGLAQPNFLYEGNSSTGSEDRGSNSISFTRSFTAAWGDDMVNPNGINQIDFFGNAQTDTAVKQFGDSSLLLDGSSDYLEGSDGTITAYGTGDFTVEHWLYLNATGAVQYIYESRPAAGTAGNYLVWMVRTDQKVYVFINGAYRIISTNALSASTWHHIALVRDGGTMTLYVDGSSEGTWTGISATSFVSNQSLIGTFHGKTGAWLNANLDEMRFSSTARYTGSFTPSTTAFTHDGQTDLLLHFNDITDAATNFTIDTGEAP